MERNFLFKERKIMDNALFMALLSIGVTLLTSLFKSVKLSKKQKTSIAAGLSILAGFASVAFVSGDFSPTNLAANAVSIFGASQAIYQFILNGTGLNKKLTDVSLFGSSTSDIEVIVAEVEKTAKAAKAVKKAAKPAVKKTTLKKKTE